jgi:thiamine pyrophosphokinase
MKLDIMVAMEGLKKDEYNPLNIELSVKRNMPVVLLKLISMVKTSIKELIEVAGSRVSEVSHLMSENLYNRDLNMATCVFQVETESDLNVKDLVYSVPKLLKMDVDSKCERVFSFAKSRFIINIQIASNELPSPFPEEEGDVWTLYTRSKEIRPCFKTSACFRYKDQESIMKFMPTKSGLAYSGMSFEKEKDTPITTQETSNKEVSYEVK